MSDLPPLSPLHKEEIPIRSKLEFFARIGTEELKASLVPGNPHSLKTRRDGTMLDGHHRIYSLRQRGVDVNTLPREVVDPDERM
jgi:hypothetical protein